MTTRPRLSPAMADVRRAIRKSWETYGYKAGDTIAVACSGGADSLALAAAAIFEGKRANIKIAVIIVNHNLQKGSASVAAKTAKLVTVLGADHVEVVEVVVAKTKQGMEADARDARYAALAEFAKSNKAKVTMLGHTQDDQAETVLLGLARGSGTKSLSGMPMLTEDKKYLRPLLGIRRSTTENFCSDSGLDFWQDPQNQDKKFSRVRVRKVLLPAMEKELGPGVIEALGRTAEILQEDAQYLDKRADQVFSKVAKVMATQVVLDADALAKQPVALANRVVLKALVLLGAEPTRTAISSVMALVTNWHGQKPLTLPAARVSRQGKQVILKSSKTLKPGAC